MAKASRNNLCPCGSGKMYKHCCGKKEAVSIESLIDREVAKCMQDVFSFALERYEEELAFMMSGSPFQGLPNELETSANLLLTNWAIFHRHVDDKGMTIFSAYMRSRRRTRWRPAVQTHLKRWDEAVPSFDEIIHIEDERRFLVRDLLTRKEKYVRFLTPEELPSAREGDVLVGCLVPHGDEWAYFMKVLPIPKSGKDRLARALQAEWNPDMKTCEVFLRESFPELLEIAVHELLWQLLSEKDWGDRDQDDVFRELKKKEETTSSLVLSEAAFLWRAYCEMDEPVIKNPAVYAAALRYLASEMAGREFVNMEKVAEHYGVPVEEVEAAVMELFLFRTELLDDGDDEGENDDEWLFDDGDDGDEIWFDDGGMEDGDELDRAIEEWLDQVEELFDCEGWDVDQVHRLIDKAIRTWKKDGLLEGVDAAELRKELEELVRETFAERGFL